MSVTVRCPDCGHVNPSTSAHCEACNFPLALEELVAGKLPPDGSAPGAPAPKAARQVPARGASAPSGALQPPAGPAAGGAEPQRGEPAAGAEPPLLLRPPIRRPRRSDSQQALSLWLMFGFIAAAAVVFVAVKANLDRASQPVEGSSKEQQEQADRLRVILARDSTDVDARIALANILYDTENWSEAVVHYRAAVRRDSSRTEALVDLGVCYYNLGQTTEAEELFKLALRRDPHQPVALFNLGILSERRSRYAEALGYYHRALQSAPPEAMKQPILEAMQRVQAAAGKTAPPLPDGR